MKKKLKPDPLCFMHRHENGRLTNLSTVRGGSSDTYTVADFTRTQADDADRHVDDPDPEDEVIIIITP